ncbi:hypothetical protein I0C86_04360 [Plantactinospora sp. S1510]|uniref:ABC transporter permease n=1 Tax=Plantactinospora alkalitolerans TaxID=2789879 RepID=A0ABS0GPW3_9ACTN|nr:hypothetical protein [Plantactinospora alkalitolerans]MBF9128230.1 hypothetical protein [Plantactinospora alkalitolerans]
MPTHRLPLWRYESRRAGWAARAAPPAALLVTLVMALLTASGGAGHDQVGQLLLTGLEAILPLAVGMAAVTIVARDGCRELQLSLPARYAGTLGRRLGVLALVGAACAVAFTAGVWLSGWWAGPNILASPLVWAPPMLWLTGLTVLLGMLGRSVVLATSVVSALWLGEQLFAGSFVALDWTRPFFLFTTSRVGVGEGWLTNRLALVGSGLLFVAVVVLLLRRPHLLLTEEEE